MPKEKRELRVYWSKKEQDIEIWRVRSPDGHLAHSSLLSNPINAREPTRPP